MSGAGSFRLPLYRRLASGSRALVVLLMIASSITGIFATFVAPPRTAQAATLRIYAAADTYIDQEKPNVNYGNQSMLRTSPKTGKRERAILSFDFTALPAGSVVDSVTFGLYEFNARAGQTMWLYRLTESFSELEATWNKRSAASAWATAGGTYDSTSLGSFPATSTGFRTLTVTATVQDWLSGLQPNAGFIIVPTGAGDTGEVSFASSEDAQVSRRPYLDITYHANSAPLVTSVGLFDSSRRNPLISLTPQTELTIGVTVTDPDMLANVRTVRATLFFDSDNDSLADTAPASGNTQTAAILIYDSRGPSWTIDPAAVSSWSIISANCAQPALAQTSGTFWFHFKPGKVAREGPHWDLYVTVQDSAGAQASMYDAIDRSMEWYGETTVNSVSVDFGQVVAGSDFSANQRDSVSVTYISNGDFNQNVAASAQWVGPVNSAYLNPSGNPGFNEFSLKADDTAVLGNAALVPQSPEYATVKGSAGPTTEAGEAASNSLWLKLGAGSFRGTYTGVMYFSISR